MHPPRRSRQGRKAHELLVQLLGLGLQIGLLVREPPFVTSGHLQQQERRRGTSSASGAGEGRSSRGTRLVQLLLQVLRVLLLERGL